MSLVVLCTYPSQMQNAFPSTTVWKSKNGWKGIVVKHLMAVMFSKVVKLMMFASILTKINNAPSILSGLSSVQPFHGGQRTLQPTEHGEM